MQYLSKKTQIFDEHVVNLNLTNYGQKKVKKSSHYYPLTSCLWALFMGGQPIS
jgi:hypothetical protein